MAKIGKKKPCAICRRWFLPQAKVKQRAKTCGNRQCQKEWHRRQCRKWNRKNKAYFRSNYLSKKLEDANGLDPPVEKDLGQAGLKQPSSAGPFLESVFDPIPHIAQTRMITIINYVIGVHIRSFRKQLIMKPPANKGSPFF
ncbi:MAG: hypothetical protein HOD85_08310 [Deltaproteobacteria bacterium]|nr:hypothetical protein [Deltaproteobacteria bacterium]MBT4641324.1 hypothetical protein [Deltaproteobacteria bacterium]